MSELKFCPGCSTLRCRTQWNRDSSARDGLTRQCRVCRAKACAAGRAQLRTWVIGFKQLCAQCGETDWRCLDFHHRDPLHKRLAVSDMVSRRMPVSVIQAEIEKCDVLCSNCHRKRTLANQPESDRPI